MKFLVTTERTGPKRQIEVRTYKTTKAMIRASKRRGFKDTDDLDGETLAVTETFTVFSSEDGFVSPKPLVGVIRLAETHLTAEVISHEATHAAMHIYAIDMMTDDDLAMDHITPSNEVIAHLVSDITELITEKLLT